MRSIRIQNPILNSYITDLSADYSSGNSVSVRSNNSFAANDLTVFGHPTEELTEQIKINAVVSNNGFTLPSSLKFQHNKGTPIYKALWDNVAIEADYGAGFSLITTSAIQWDSKTNETIYFDSNGTDATSYRFRFYNSITLTYSEYSPTLTGAGFTKYQMGYIIREARRIAGDKEGRILEIGDCLRILTRAKNIIRSHNARYWFWKVNGFNSNKSILATANNNVYSLASISDLGIIDLIEYRYIQGSTDMRWILRRKPDAEFLEYARNALRPAINFPHYFRLLPPDSNSSKGYFEIENKIKDDSIGIFYPDYYKEETDYNSVDDLTAVIMPEILEDYLTAAIYEAKGNQTQADKFYGYFIGPESKEKTNGLENLRGLALLDELDRQYKTSQGQPSSLWRFRGQKAITRLYGNRRVNNPDYIRENYFDGPEY